MPNPLQWPTPLTHALSLLALVLMLSLTSVARAGESPININQANAEVLTTLEGIGPAKAQAIIEFRDNEGDFVTVDHLEEVPGIGLITVENNRARITVDNPPATQAMKQEGEEP